MDRNHARGNLFSRGPSTNSSNSYPPTSRQTEQRQEVPRSTLFGRRNETNLIAFDDDGEGNDGSMNPVEEDHFDAFDAWQESSKPARPVVAQGTAMLLGNTGEPRARKGTATGTSDGHSHACSSEESSPTRKEPRPSRTGDRVYSSIPQSLYFQLESDANLDMNALTLMEQVVLLGLKDKQGYMSLLNDSISYVLRGCLIMELAFRGRIRTLEAFPLRHPAERHLEAVSLKMTGDVLLDETLRWIRAERHTIAGWIDLLSGETWNPLKIGYQLRQVRERICKGLVDKGVLRSERRSFLLFDMPVHPLAAPAIKADLVRSIVGFLLDPPPAAQLDVRLLALVLAAYSANVLDNVLGQLSRQSRDLALRRAQEWRLLYAKEDVVGNDILAAVFSIFSRMDSLII